MLTKDPRNFDFRVQRFDSPIASVVPEFPRLFFADGCIGANQNSVVEIASVAPNFDAFI